MCPHVAPGYIHSFKVSSFISTLAVTALLSATFYCLGTFMQINSCVLL